MYAITIDGERVGAVDRFAGNPAASRWVAYAVGSDEQPGFRTQREAIAWVERVAAVHRAATARPSIRHAAAPKAATGSTGDRQA